LAIVEEAEARTASNGRFHLQVAFNYGARADIVEAARSFAKAVERGDAHADQLDEHVFQAALSTSPAPGPDLIIRTSGEQRLSNFLLWECAYAELARLRAGTPERRHCGLPLPGTTLWRGQRR
jgi:undecaprenyl diphosphate synthase